MRAIFRVAAVSAAVAVAATVSWAFVGPRFAIRSRIDISYVAEGPAPGPGQRGQIIRQRIRLESVSGSAVVTRGSLSGDPLTLRLEGDWDVTRSTPGLLSPATLLDVSVGFPVTKTNSAETKGSLKAGDDVYVPYREALEALLSEATLVGGAQPMAKPASFFLEGNMITSTLKQTGKLKVDKQTFTRLKGKVAVKGVAYMQDGPFSGYDVKYTLKARIRP